MTYSQYKRDLAVRILRKIDGRGQLQNMGDLERIDKTIEALDEFLPKDESGKRGTTKFTDLVSVYKVDCPDCGNHGFDDEHQEYTDVHPFCGNCGYCFN
jgi:ribosomal protein S27AE